MRILFLAKRHYTNKDALAERFGRVYRLPKAWHESGEPVCLHLVDYRGNAMAGTDGDGFPVRSWPVRSPRAIRSLWRSAMEFKPDVLLTAGDNLLGLLGWWMAQRAGARFVFDAYDDYRQFGSSRLLLGWNAFDWLRRRADATFYASQRLVEDHPANRPCLVVANAVAPADFAGHDPRESRRRAGLPDEGAVIGYFGSMEADRGVNDLIAAVHQLRAQGRNVLLLLAGRRSASTPLDPELTPWIRYAGMVPHSEVPMLMAACDVLALPYRRSPIMDMGVSCKIGEYLYSKRAIAATDTPNFAANFPMQHQFLRDRLAEAGKAADLARVIGLQLDQPRIAPLPEHISWEGVAGRALAMLRSLPAGTPRS